MREARSKIRMVLCVSQPFSTKLYLALSVASIPLYGFSFESWRNAGKRNQLQRHAMGGNSMEKFPASFSKAAKRLLGFQFETVQRYFFQVKVKGLKVHKCQQIRFIFHVKNQHLI